jgi:hypothetical protein
VSKIVERKTYKQDNMARTKLNDAVSSNLIATAASEVPEDVQTAMKEYWLKLLEYA